MTRIIMHGCNGRMGQMITGIVKEFPDAEIVAGIDIADNITTNGYPVFTDIDACDVQADVVIDFSSAKAVDNLMDYCEKNNLPQDTSYRRGQKLPQVYDQSRRRCPATCNLPDSPT